MSDVPWEDLGNLPSPVTPGRGGMMDAPLSESPIVGRISEPHEAFNAPMDDHAPAVTHDDGVSEDHDDSGHDDGHDDGGDE